MSDEDMAAKDVLKPTADSVVHIAAAKVTVGEASRQRCAWCGDSLSLTDGVAPESAPLLASVGDRVRIRTGGLVRIVARGDNASRALIGHLSERRPLPIDCCVYRDVPVF